MRINRLTLRNFRGVTSAEVTFPSEGVTIIEGDNEAGKSSLAEALTMVLEVRDDSRKQGVMAVKPVHRDAGPEVEVDLSTGPYRIEYSKRWLRKPETTLTVIEPVREQLTGREAHERVLTILGETLDGDLWRALRLEQGADLDQVDFGVPSLGRALDLAAGGGDEDHHHDGLWERIVAERNSYWTASGQPSSERKRLAERVAGAEARVSSLQSELRELDSQTDEMVRLEKEATELAGRQVELERAVVEYEGRLVAVEELRRFVGHIESRRDGVAADHRHWLQLSEIRDGLISAELEQVRRLDRAEEELVQVEPARSAARAAVDSGEGDRDSLQSALKRAEAVHDLSVADTDFRRQQIEVEQFVERRDRVRRNQAALESAEAVLEANCVDAAVLDRIESAHLDFVRAEAAAAGGAVRLTVTALSGIEVVAPESAVALSAGESHLLAVATNTQLSIPGVVQVDVEVGQEAQTLHEGQLRAAQELARLCREHGVADLDQARAAANARADAERIRSRAVEQIRDDLRDLTLEALERKISRHAERIASYAAERGPEPALPEDLDSAQEIREQAERAASELRTQLAAVEAELAAANLVLKEADVTSAGLDAQVNAERAALERVRAGLAQARLDQSDLAIAAGLEAAANDLAAVDGELSDGRARLAREDAETLDQLVDNARSARLRGTNAITTNQRARDSLAAVLASRGEQGLAHNLDLALTERDHLRLELERLEARAAAALLLHDTFAVRRAAARARYQAPFRERIEQLGRLVFGPSLEVTLDDDLKIQTRTLDGITVGYQQLSTGAREQLGVLSRLACAMIVSGDGGAPVIFDDTLGWTDPGRLTQMASAIALASRQCQVVVLTCSPGRFAGIGDAHVVRLPTRGAVSGGEPAIVGPGPGVSTPWAAGQ